MNIGRQIKRKREELGISQSELARKLEVTPQSVQQWEDPDPEKATNPRGKRLEALARCLHTTVAYLMTGEEEAGRVREPKPEYLSDRQARCLECFNRLSPKTQEIAITIMQSLAETDQVPCPPLADDMEEEHQKRA